MGKADDDIYIPAVEELDDPPLTDLPPLKDMRPVDSLIMLPDNPRRGDIGAISESLRRFGQQKPIVINTDGVILAGNHTYQAAVALGWPEVWVAESELAGSDQTGFALADNRLSDLATYDHDLLASKMVETELDGTGYDSADLDRLREYTAPVEWDTMGLEGVGSSPTATRTFHIPKDRVAAVDDAIASTQRQLSCSSGEALASLVVDVS
jgi:hypothetical protein